VRFSVVAYAYMTAEFAGRQRQKIILALSVEAL
jgi:hypothetical protein